MPDVRRGANGQIEAVPASPAPAAPAGPAAPSAPSVAAPVAAGPLTVLHYNLSPDTLPAPHATKPEDIAAEFAPRPAGTMPRVPKGFAISIFAGELDNPRWLAVAPNGDVFLAQPGAGRIVVLRDSKGSGVADAITTFAEGFQMPHGLAFHGGALYVGDLQAVWRLPYRDGDQVASAAPRRVTTAPDLRPDGWHWTRNIAIDSKGKIFLGIGAKGDLLEDVPPAATVQEIGSDGAMTIFAGGIRNAVGLAFYPGTDDLWVTVNERDRLGSHLPPDFITLIRKGDFLGWPYAYIGPHPDPDFGAKRPDLVAKTKVPEVLLEAHSAPLGIVFYTGAQFPADYKGDAFVALHGPGPYDKPNGYKVVRVRFKNGTPVGGYEDFVGGFLLPGAYPPHAWGTPAGLAVAKDGSLLIADETSRIVWRVAYTGK